MKKYTIVIVTLFWINIIHGQEWVNMQNEGKSFAEITQLMDKNFEGKSTLKSDPNYDRAYKKYARWEYFWRYQLDEKGGFVSNNQVIDSWNQTIDLEAKSTNKSVSSNWTFVGQPNIPTSRSETFAGMGRVNSITFHPTNPNIIWAGTANGGIWRTSNNGTNWVPTGGNLPVFGVSDIVVSNSADTLYIATGDADGLHSLSVGVMFSTNGGTSFNTTGNIGAPPIPGDPTFTNADGQYAIHHLWINPNNSRVVVATTTRGIYRTTNAGGTWTQVEQNPATDLKYIRFSNGSDALYAGSIDAVIQSTDGGTTWSNPITTINGAQKIDLAVSLNSGGTTATVYAISDNAIGQVSTNSGSTWASMSLPDGSERQDGLHRYNTQDGYDMAIVADPANPDRVLLGGVQGYVSTNRGNSWVTNLNGLRDRSTEGQYVHSDHHMMRWHPTNSNIQYSAHDGGIATGNFFDASAAFTDISDDLDITQYYGFDGFPTNENILIAGAQDQDGVFWNGTTWTNIANNTDGTGGLINNMNSNISFIKSQSGFLHRTLDGYATLEQQVNVAAQGDQADFVWPLEMDRTTPTTLYAGYSNIYKTTDNGDSWTNMTNNQGNSFVPYVSIAVSTSNTMVVYAVQQGNIVTRSLDGGSTWTSVTPPSVSGASITDVQISLTNQNEIYLTYGNYVNGSKVFISSNGGASWSNISQGLPNWPVYDLAQQASNSTLFIGTHMGVYQRCSTCSTWEAFNTNLPPVRVSDVDVFQQGNVLRAATFGRGIWRSPIGAATAPPCSNTGTTAVAQSDLTPNAVFHNGTITSGGTGSNNVNVNVNNVTFRAVNMVNINPEFEVTTPNMFTAEIAPCPN